MKRNITEPTIKIKLDSGNHIVSKAAYIKAKTGDLRNFGYSNLTESEVANQLEKILNGEELDVIGMFMESDIVR